MEPKRPSPTIRSSKRIQLIHSSPVKPLADDLLTNCRVTSLKSVKGRQQRSRSLSMDHPITVPIRQNVKDTPKESKSIKFISSGLFEPEKKAVMDEDTTSLDLPIALVDGTDTSSLTTLSKQSTVSSSSSRTNSPTDQPRSSSRKLRKESHTQPKAIRVVAPRIPSSTTPVNVPNPFKSNYVLPEEKKSELEHDLHAIRESMYFFVMLGKRPRGWA